MTINFLAWIKKLRRPKRSPQFRSAFISYAEAMEGHEQELAQLKRLQSSAPSGKPEPMAYWAGEIAAPAPAPLLLAIRSAIDNEPFGDEPRAVLLAVAKWLRSVGHKFAARDLEREANN